MRPRIPVQLRLRWLSLLALSTLCACAGPRSSPMDKDPYDGVSTVSASGSILRLPDDLADLRLSTRRTVDRGTVVEDVILANETSIPNENIMTTRTRWRGIGAYLPAEMPSPFKQDAIEQRFAKEFPGAPLDTMARERTNGRGVHRYLLADMGDAGSCIYAWQFFDARTDLRGETHSFALDLRYCVPEKDAVRMLDLFDRVATRSPL